MVQEPTREGSPTEEGSGGVKFVGQLSVGLGGRRFERRAISERRGHIGHREVGGSSSRTGRPRVNTPFTSRRRRRCRYRQPKAATRKLRWRLPSDDQSFWRLRYADGHNGRRFPTQSTGRIRISGCCRLPTADDGLFPDLRAGRRLYSRRSLEVQYDGVAGCAPSSGSDADSAVYEWNGWRCVCEYFSIGSGAD